MPTWNLRLFPRAGCRSHAGPQLRPAYATLFTLVITLLGAGSAQATPQQILVEVVKPPVMVFDSPDQKKGAPLKAGKQTIAAGKWLKAGKSGKTFGVVRAYTLRGVKESKADGWLALTPLAAAEATPYAAMLAEIMRPAGRLKGAPTPIKLWYPGQFGKTWASNFRLRWVPATVKTLTFKVMSDGSAEPLWESGEVDPAAGSLDDPKLTEELKKALAAGASGFTLEIQADDQPFQQPLHFANAASQLELTTQLEWWSKHAQGAACHLGQAGEFQKRGFLADAAQSYLAAWQLSPKSGIARDAFKSSLARLGLEDDQIVAVVNQVSPHRKGAPAPGPRAG